MHLQVNVSTYKSMEAHRARACSSDGQLVAKLDALSGHGGAVVDGAIAAATSKLTHCS